MWYVCSVLYGWVEEKVRVGLKGLFLLPTCHSKREVRQRVMCVQCFLRVGRGEGTGGP